MMDQREHHGDGAALAERAPTRGWGRRARLPAARVALTVGALLGFVALALLVLRGDTDAVDRAILLALRTPDDPADPLGPGWLERFMTDATGFGDRSILGVVAVLVAGYLALLRRWSAVLLMLVALVGGAVLTDLMKGLVDRPRPELVRHLVEVRSRSFPSGHASSAALAYLTFAAFLARTLPAAALRAYVIGAALFLTVLAGLSRVYLGVHYPSDVLGGWCLGWSWAMACWLAASASIDR